MLKDTARFYDIPGVGRLPSVTTILQVIAKPALYAWHAKHGSAKALMVIAHLSQRDPLLADQLRADLGPKFFKNGTTLAEEAADYGKQAHALIEADLKGAGLVMDGGTPEPVQKAISAYQAWRARTQFKVIKSECLVYSKKLGYAGTADAIGETKDGVTLLDWKTSGGIWPDYHLQTVAYKHAAEELSGEFIPNVVICRFGKDGAFEDYTVPQIQHADLLDRFMDAKRLWEWQRGAA